MMQLILLIKSDQLLAEENGKIGKKPRVNEHRIDQLASESVLQSGTMAQIL